MARGGGGSAGDGVGPSVGSSPSGGGRGDTAREVVVRGGLGLSGGWASRGEVREDDESPLLAPPADAPLMLQHPPSISYANRDGHGTLLHAADGDSRWDEYRHHHHHHHEEEGEEEERLLDRGGEGRAGGGSSGDGGCGVFGFGVGGGVSARRDDVEDGVGDEQGDGGFGTAMTMKLGTTRGGEQPRQPPPPHHLHHQHQQHQQRQQHQQPQPQHESHSPFAYSVGDTPSEGLSYREAATRLRHFGPNEMPPPPDDRWRRLARELRTPAACVIWLAVALQLSQALRDTANGVIDDVKGGGGGGGGGGGRVAHFIHSAGASRLNSTFFLFSFFFSDCTHHTATVPRVKPSQSSSEYTSDTWTTLYGGGDDEDDTGEGGRGAAAWMDVALLLTLQA